MVQSAEDAARDEDRLSALVRDLAKKHGITRSRRLREVVEEVLENYWIDKDTPPLSELAPEIAKINDAAWTLIELLEEERIRLALMEVDPPWPAETCLHAIRRMLPDLPILFSRSREWLQAFAPRPGRPRISLAVFNAVSTMKYRWPELTDERPTRRFSESGEPLSPFARFVVAVLRHVDPDLPVQHLQQIHTAMRQLEKKTG